MQSVIEVPTVLYTVGVLAIIALVCYCLRTIVQTVAAISAATGEDNEKAELESSLDAALNRAEAAEANLLYAERINKYLVDRVQTLENKSDSLIAESALQKFAADNNAQVAQELGDRLNKSNALLGKAKLTTIFQGMALDAADAALREAAAQVGDTPVGEPRPGRRTVKK